jgi:DNA polymerase III delta prime subunit
MGRPEKTVDPARGPVAAFAHDLRRLRAEAGTPTYRQLARRARFSPSVLSSAASGYRLPSLQVTLAFVAACGGDREQWRRQWLRVRGLDGNAPPESSRPLAHREPERCRPPRPAGLPLRPRGCAVRTELLQQLLAGPTTPPLLICGPFGVGKSELALRLAHELADGANGQLYADFTEIATGTEGAHLALDGFLPALGVPPDLMPGAVDQRAALYRSLLTERRTVVLLEGVRDERQVRSLLPESNRSHTIIVSRSSLLGLRDVRRLRLAALTRAQSLALILAVVPAHARSDLEACDRLAELCGDLPLALDIASRKLAARPEVALRALLDRLVGPAAWLHWLQLGDLSVRESLALAYRQLSSEAGMVLHRLVSRDAGRRPPGEPDHEATEELLWAGMARRVPGSDRVLVPPLVRAFARMQRAGEFGSDGHAELIVHPGQSCRSTCRIRSTELVNVDQILCHRGGERHDRQ